jgi:hypothetical protein
MKSRGIVTEGTKVAEKDKLSPLIIGRVGMHVGL